MVSLSVILALGFAGFALAAKKKAVAQEVVPEEAKRYLGQGKAIMERAKSPQDYEEAIRAFEKAAGLAPTWPDIYDDLAYAQENAEKYAEAVKSLRKYLTLVPSNTDVKFYEVRIYKLEEKMKYTAGSGGDERLAQKLVGTWVDYTQSCYWEIEATGAKVRGKQYYIHDPNSSMRKGVYEDAAFIFDAEVVKSRLIGTFHSGKYNLGAMLADQTLIPMNWGFNLSPDGRSLTFAPLQAGHFSGRRGTFLKTTEHFLKEGSG